MASSWRVVVVYMLAAGCGLERDYEAFLAASQSASGDNSSGDSSSSSSAGPQTDTGTTGPGSDTGSGSSEVASASTSAGETSSESTDAAGESSSGSSSTGTAGWCGDGIVDAPQEDCDDGNADETDRCTSTCKTIRLIFVTSVRLQGNINGLVNADANCKSLAFKAMMADPTSRITNASNFKALLATSTQTVFDRHFPGQGPYQLVNGLRVSDSFAQLFSEPHYNPVNVDERSMTQSTGVWTGLAADGQSFPDIDFCKNWTTTLGTTTWGYTDFVDGWLFFDVLGNPTIDCGDEFALYCLEQE